MDTNETVLKQQIEEWRSLNDYPNKIDAGYQTTFEDLQKTEL